MVFHNLIVQKMFSCDEPGHSLGKVMIFTHVHGIAARRHCKGGGYHRRELRRPHRRPYRPKSKIAVAVNTAIISLYRLPEVPMVK